MMSEKRLYDVIDKEEPRGQSVSYQGIPCTAKHCCTNLNRLTEENDQLRKENKRLKERNDELEESSAFIIEQREENKQLKEQVQILKKEVRDFLHLCDVCDIQSHLSDECEEVLNDE